MNAYIYTLFGMDDPATKGVLLDSIETHREHLLSKEEQRIYSFRKGKSPATEQDEEREAQLEKQLKDLADNYKSISENEATAMQRERTRGANSDSTSLVSPEKWPLVAQKDIILERLESSSEDDEPIWNPLTSSYAHRETGFEPGPSKSRYGSDTPESSDNGYHGRVEAPTIASPPSQERHIPPSTSPYPISPASTGHGDIGRDDSVARLASTRLGRLSFNVLRSWVTPRVMGAVWAGKPSDAHPAKLDAPPEREEGARCNNSGKPQMPALPESQVKKAPTQLRKLRANSQLDDKYHVRAAIVTETTETPDDGFTPDPRSSSDSSKIGDLTASRSIDGSSVESTDGPATQVKAQLSRKRPSGGKITAKRVRKHGIVNHISSKENAPASSDDESERSTAEESYFEASRREALRLDSLYRQQEQDRELAERLARDEDLATAFQDLEIRNDEQSTLLAINLASGFVQDQSAFALQQLEEQEFLSQFQDQASTQERQLQADMELAMRLHEESSLMESDHALAQRLQSESSRPGSRLDTIVDSETFDTPARTTLSSFNNFFSPAFATQSPPLPSRRRSPVPIQRIEAKTRRRDGHHINRQGAGWSYTPDLSISQTLQQEEDQQYARDRAEAQRIQDTLQAQDKIAQDRFKAEQVGFKGEEFAECLICTDHFVRAEMLRPCKHWYCRGCLAGAFRNAYNSKPKKPFRCCQSDISVDLVMRELGAVFVRDYKAFELERSTANPLYCSNKGCADFLPPADIHGDNGTCRKCRRQTCRHCRSRAHPGKLCSKDMETEKVKVLANKQGWKACPGCSHMIMRNEGCLHMTCSQCRTEFCYNCGSKNCRGTCRRT
ncbi:hypothetical protein N7G274_002817 [Stereocaulon virgatum]|uniref:RBR-type E3 ubiquitin transferase n=1 Tax=Stereocaulon virgatum TaxID=373712 RepID=A0ABR4AGX3_9LECA